MLGLSVHQGGLTSMNKDGLHHLMARTLYLYGSIHTAGRKRINLALLVEAGR